MTNEHDPLRDLIHQSLVSDKLGVDKLAPSAELRAALDERLEQRLDDETVITPAKPQPEQKPRRRIVRPWHMALVITAVLAVMVYLSLPERWKQLAGHPDLGTPAGGMSAQAHREESIVTANEELSDGYFQFELNADDSYLPSQASSSEGVAALPDYLQSSLAERNETQIELDPTIGNSTGVDPAAAKDISTLQGTGLSGRGAAGHGKPGVIGGGGYAVLPPVAETGTRESFSAAGPNGEPGEGKGMGPVTFNDRNEKTLNQVYEPQAAPDAAQGELTTEQLTRRGARSTWSVLREQSARAKGGEGQEPGFRFGNDINGDRAPGTEQYSPIIDNPFLPVKDAPLSTFSIDVDTASYANVRRFLTQGQVPPADAVRIEELLNYFTYDYPAPKGDEPFSVNMETAPCPWQEDHLLLRVGLKGKEVHKAERPASNLVFLIDTSGSMADEDKLPLVKQAMSMLTRELGERDRITIVTYAGEAGLKLAPTGGHDHATITSVINSLNSNGSTHGSAGIQLAYQKARESFVKEGTNRVILCTDGDLNVGITQDDQLVDLISKEAKTGVFLTVLGFGQGNLKDSKMEKLADHGNGVYAYIDGVREAKKVLVDQLSGSLTTIAKDVKNQIEFNPAQIRSYRLIGYENRLLAAKDFNDDTKDAGEIGAGHTVTALYELVPAGAAEPKPVLDELKYQERRSQESGVRGQKEEEGEQSKELLTLKLRFKQPDGDVSKKIEYPLAEKGTRFTNASSDFRFAASVAAFGMILRDSPHRGGITMAGVGEIAASSLGEDTRGYRAEFLDLVRRAEKLGKR